MKEVDRRVMPLRRMAWLCAALVLTITSLSAFLRLEQAGLGCTDWPGCYGRALSAPTVSTSAQHNDTVTTAARFAHRVAASAAGLLVVAMALLCLGARPRLRREGRLALGLFACAVFLAVLGRSTAHARIPAVAIGNVLVGFVMFALSWRLARTAGTTATDDRSRSLAPGWITLALLLCQIVLGVLISAGFAGLSCPELLRCEIAPGAWQGLDPWRDPSTTPSDLAGAGGSLANVLHRLGAVILAALLALLAASAWKRGRRGAALAVMSLLVVQLALGTTLVLARLPLTIAVAHNIVAALLLAGAFELALSHRRRRLV